MGTLLIVNATMGLIDDCIECFSTRCFYEVLKISKDAVDTQIKKSYRKISLKVHPDRALATDKELATTKFQVLSKVTKILLDKDQRSLYDETGQVLDDCDNDDVINLKNWNDYFKSLYKLDISDVKKFHAEYRYSDIEVEDLKQNYVDIEGDMNKLFEFQLCSEIDDEPRFRKIIDEAIEKGEVPSFDKYVNESEAKKKKRKNRWVKERKEAKKAIEKMGVSVDQSKEDLSMMIKNKNKSRQDSFLAELEAKYCKPKKKARKKAS